MQPVWRFPVSSEGVGITQGLSSSLRFCHLERALVGISRSVCKLKDTWTHILVPCQLLLREYIRNKLWGMWFLYTPPPCFWLQLGEWSSTGNSGLLTRCGTAWKNCIMIRVPLFSLAASLWVWSCSCKGTGAQLPSEKCFGHTVVELRHARADGPGKASKTKIPLLFGVYLSEILWDSIRQRALFLEAWECRGIEKRQLGKVY